MKLLEPLSRKKTWALVLLSVAATFANAASEKTSDAVNGIDDLLNAKPEQAKMAESISAVRQAALGNTAQVLGSQRGFGDRSRQIISQIESMAPSLERAYQFNALMMGSGFLPPVIDEVVGAVTLDQLTMRVSGRIYSILEPARPVMIAPTWRDWLLMGLDGSLNPPLPEYASLLPRDDAERAYWSEELKKAYQAGKAQAQEVFDLNKAKLDRAYLGMRRFYRLYAAGMVTAPEIVSSSTIVDREDGNTILVGTTFWRIVKASDFVDDHQQWKPLGQ